MRHAGLVLTIGIMCAVGMRAVAQDPPPDPDAETTSVAPVGRASVWRLVVQANPLLWPLAACSVVVVTAALERMIALRGGRVLPRAFIERFLDRLKARKLDRERALELCRAHPSPAARVFALATRYWGRPVAEARMGLALDAAGEVLDLRRNLRAFAATAAIAPLLGLLGTVVGLIESFDALGGKVGTAKGEALASGISLALVTTAIGLGVAVAALMLYYVFLGTADRRARELDERAREVLDLIAEPPGSGRSAGDRRLAAPAAEPVAADADAGI